MRQFMIKMRLTALCLASALATTMAFAEQTQTSLKSKDEKISYSIGVDIGKSFQEQNIVVIEKAFLAGIRDGQKNKPALMTDEEIKNTLVSLQKELMEKQQEEAKKVAMKNKTEGDKFLTDNKNKTDIKTTDSGLQYRVLKEGNGTSPKATDQVVTHYRGKLIDGTVFDSSYERGEPVTFPVNGVIPGWTEALQMMKPGSKWELFIPSDLAYGPNGVGGVIPPNSVLHFEVELIKVLDADQSSDADSGDAGKKTQKTSSKK